MTITREYRRFLDRPALGSSATVDEFLGTFVMGSTAQILTAVDHIPADAPITFVAPVAGSSGRDYWLTYYLASYLLVPRPVRLVAWCESAVHAETCKAFPAVTDVKTAVAALGARHMLVAGTNSPPVEYLRARRVAPRLTLLNRP